jgi:uncharacterized membrane protein YdjX (TVP38/TMEM64 family)
MITGAAAVDDRRGKTGAAPVVFLILFAAATAFLAILAWPFIKKLEDPLYRERFGAWISALGPRGVLILLGIQVLQVVIAVIPGEPVEILAGAAYGALGGLGICLSGCAAASALVFILVKKFGAPLVTRLFGEKNSRAYAFLQDTPRISRAVFILFLIPGTPKDLLTYIVPLSKLGLVRFIFISAFARIPSIVSSTMMGDSMIQGNRRLLLVIFGITAVTGLLGFYFKERVIAWSRNRE